jgi:hypothetical protein
MPKCSEKRRVDVPPHLVSAGSYRTSRRSTQKLHPQTAPPMDLAAEIIFCVLERDSCNQSHKQSPHIHRKPNLRFLRPNRIQHAVRTACNRSVRSRHIQQALDSQEDSRSFVSRISDSVPIASDLNPKVPFKISLVIARSSV